MRIVVLGSDGMLGTELVRVLDGRNGIKVIAVNRKEIDITKQKDIELISGLKASHIVNCAAMTNVDRCETEQARCFEVNSASISGLIRIANAGISQIVYPQTFLVYGSSTRAQNEESFLAPTSVYARSKLCAEKELNCKAAIPPLILRIGGFMGGFDKDKNFVGKLVRFLLDPASMDERPVLSVGERVWQPTNTQDIAINLSEMLIGNMSGVWNMACHGHCTFYDLAVSVVDYLGLSGKINISRACQNEISSKDVAKRPMSVIMNTDKLKNRGFDMQRGWEESLKGYILEYQKRFYNY